MGSSGEEIRSEGVMGNKLAGFGKALNFENKKGGLRGKGKE